MHLVFSFFLGTVASAIFCPFNFLTSIRQRVRENLSKEPLLFFGKVLFSFQIRNAFLSQLRTVSLALRCMSLLLVVPQNSVPPSPGFVPIHFLFQSVISPFDVQHRCSSHKYGELTDDCCKQARIMNVFAFFTLPSSPLIKQFASLVDKSNVSTLHTQERLHLSFYICARHALATSIHLVLPQP